MLHRIALSTAVLAACAFGQAKPDLTLDQIIEKHVEALGGLDRVKAIRTFSATGKAIMGGGQVIAPMTMRMKRPSSIRVDMTVEGKTITQGFDGTTAWRINPASGSDAPRKGSAADAEEMKSSADIDFSVLVNYKAKGNSVDLLGIEDVEGRPAYKLKVTRNNGRVEYAYLDEETFLFARTTTKRKQMGNEVEIDAYPSNYKPVNGVLFPFTVEQKNSGQTIAQIAFEKVEVNVPIDDSQFRMPEKQ